MGAKANKKKKVSKRWAWISNRQMKKKQEAAAKSVREHDGISGNSLSQHRDSLEQMKHNVNDDLGIHQEVLETSMDTVADLQQVSTPANSRDSHESQGVSNSLACKQAAESNLTTGQLFSAMSEMNIQRDLHELDEEVVNIDGDTPINVKSKSKTFQGCLHSVGKHSQDQSIVNTVQGNIYSMNPKDSRSSLAYFRDARDTSRPISYPHIFAPSRGLSSIVSQSITQNNARRIVETADVLHDSVLRIPTKNYSRLYANSTRKYAQQNLSTPETNNDALHRINLVERITLEPSATPKEQSMDISVVDSATNHYSFDDNVGDLSPTVDDGPLSSEGPFPRFGESSASDIDIESEIDHDDTHIVLSEYSNGSDDTDIDVDLSMPPGSKDKEFHSSVDDNDDDDDAQFDDRFPEAIVDGRRIVDITQLFGDLHKKFDLHNNCEGRLTDLCMYKVADRGMRTALHFICRKCEYKDKVWTSPQTPIDKAPLLESAVQAALTAGVGFSTVQELLAGMSVPFVSPNIYRKNRMKLLSDIRELCENEFRDAGIKERELAFAENRLVNGKYPWTTVVGDGVWSRRSYTHGRHDALSGAAVLIGAYTRRILFVGVRNKYCSMCRRYEALGQKVPVHDCYKNWGCHQSSTAMEADIIVEGFTKSMETHGLIYKQFIGDGDSSVHDKICNNHIYERYGVSVDKIECWLHLMRCFGTKMDIISKMKAAKPLPRGSIGKLRARVSKCPLPMRRYVEGRIAHYQNSNMAENDKIAELMKDISNMIGHFFGNHSLCDSSFEDCNDSEEDLTPQLWEAGFYSEIEEAVGRLVRNVPSLLKLEDTNPAEWYNSIQNKANGGRRINYSLRESYLLRAYVAALQFNTQEALSRINQYRGFPIPTTVSKMESRRKAQNQRTASYRERKRRKRKYRQGTDKDYGVYCNKPDISQDMYDRLVAEHFKKLWERLFKAKEIQEGTIDQHRCEMWKEYRKCMITASKFGEICRMQDKTSCHSKVCAIRYPRPIDTEGTRYGISNETQAIKDLAKVLNKEIRPCGLFIDEKAPYLGATPDGLIGTDGIVEVKCLSLADNCTPEEAIAKYPNYTRIFHQEKKKRGSERNPVQSETMNKKHFYYYQVQGQLHVTQREYCEFAVWTPHGIKHVTVLRDDQFWATEMKDKLERFYMNCLLPEIIDARKTRGKRVKDPQYILDAQEREKTATANKKRKADVVKASVPKRQKKTAIIANKNKTQVPLENDSIPDNDSAEVKFPADNDAKIIRKNNAPWVIIRDEEVDDREPEGWEVEIVQIALQSITDEEVIPQIDSPTTLLSSDAIDQFLKIIEATTDCFVHFSHYFTLRHLIEPSQSIQDIQIMGGNSTGHWCCAYYDGTNLFIYDSGRRVEYEHLASDEKKYIKKRYPNLQPDDVIFQPVTGQPDRFSCGVYAVAFATTLALHNDPMLVSRMNYSRVAHDMRQHMISIIRQKQLIEFPTVDLID